METSMAFSVKDILQMEVTPALGCTEPVAIALGAAAAASLLPGKEIDFVEAWVDPNIYKNGMAVIIPGTGGMTGLDTASAVGACGCDPHRGLELLDTLDENGLAKAKTLLEGGNVTVNLLEDSGLHVITKITSGSDVARSEVKDLHNNIIALSLNETPIVSSPLLSKVVKENGKSAMALLEEWLMGLSLDDIYELVDEIDA